MTAESFQAVSREILEEISRMLGAVEAGGVTALENAILGAKSVFVAGAGRSGLMGRCFATRLAHLGLTSHAVGDTTTPPVAKGDLLIAISASGETDTISLLARRAAQLGARVAAVTCKRHSQLAGHADLLVIMPAGDSGQYGGSLVEQCALLLLDAIALDLQHRLGQTAQQMDARHANLE
jgi:6-phospho-3-hexuloisomerase